jgi:ribosomal protein S18 acetylase RimI-like enzyme
MEERSVAPMTAFKIRRATIEDIPSIQTLYLQEEDVHRSLYPHYFHEKGTILSEQTLKKELQDAKLVYQVATMERRCVGFVFAKIERFSREPHFKKVEYALIEDCVVLESCRRRGIATALVREVCNWVKAQGLDRVQLQVWANNEPALRLYRKLGFADLILRMELIEGSRNGAESS